MHDALSETFFVLSGRYNAKNVALNMTEKAGRGEPNRHYRAVIGVTA
jgi:hypothetical protein